MKIVVTGFGPFGVHKTNASWEAVKMLPALNSARLNGIELMIEEIPVEYHHVQTNIPEKWLSLDLDFIVHVGVSSRDTDICIEVQACNEGYVREDVGMLCPDNSVCVPCSAATLRTCLDTEKLLAAVNGDLQAKGMSASLSQDAGRYLCEFVYYKSLCRTKGRCLFIHVPPLDQPYSGLQLTEALSIILHHIRGQVMRSTATSEGL